MLGIIDVGGGMRYVFGAGVLDYCLDHCIQFDYCLGVSAGASNLIGYLAQQPGRSKTFYTDYAFRDDYMGVKHYKETGDFINLDYIYGTLSNHDGEYPLDLDRVKASSAQFVTVATDAFTGKATYFTKDDLAQDRYGAIAASACVPVVNRPLAFQGSHYVDGGVSDPIPIETAQADGVTKTVVILTRPKDYFRRSRRDLYFVLRLRREYPALARALSKRAETYNRQLRRILADDNTLVIAPKSTLHMKTLKLDLEKMNILYEEGYKKGAQIEKWLAR